jgi:AcrR family transcriptional regulator
MTEPATAAPGARRRARSPKGEGQRLREEILDTCEALLLASGTAEAVSIRAVADAVGVSPPSIYRHFPDKATLMYEVWDRRCGTLDAAFDRAVVGVDDPVEALFAVGRAYVHFGLDNPEPYRLVFMTRPDPDAAEEDAARLGQQSAFARTVEVVQAAIDAGRLKPQYTDATRVATIVWAHVHGLVSLMLTKPAFPWPEDPDWIDEAVAAGAAGFLADPAWQPAPPPASDG